MTFVVRLLLGSGNMSSPNRPPVATVNQRVKRVSQRDGAVAVTATCRVEPGATDRRSSRMTLNSTYTCPLAPEGRDAPVTRNPSGGVIAAAPMVRPGVDVFANATSNVVELPFCTDPGEMLTL